MKADGRREFAQVPVRWPTPLLAQNTDAYFWVSLTSAILTPGSNTVSTNATGYKIRSPIDLVSGDFTEDDEVLLLFGSDLNGIYGNKQIVIARRAVNAERFAPESSTPEYVVKSNGFHSVIGRVTASLTATIWHSTDSEASVSFCNALGFDIEVGNLVELTYIRPSPGVSGYLIATSVHCDTGTGAFAC